MVITDSDGQLSPTTQESKRSVVKSTIVSLNEQDSNLTRLSPPWLYLTWKTFSSFALTMTSEIPLTRILCRNRVLVSSSSGGTFHLDHPCIRVGEGVGFKFQPIRVLHLITWLPLEQSELRIKSRDSYETCKSVAWRSIDWTIIGGG